MVDNFWKGSAAEEHARDEADPAWRAKFRHSPEEVVRLREDLWAPYAVNREHRGQAVRILRRILYHGVSQQYHVRADDGAEFWVREAHVA